MITGSSGLSEALTMTSYFKPTFGAHATSLTQSFYSPTLCYSNPSSNLVHSTILLSLEADTNRKVGTYMFNSSLIKVGWVGGAQETEFTLSAWPLFENTF